MSLQYLQYNKGTSTVVLIPIDEWKRITEKYKDLEEIRQWRKNLIDHRLKHLQNHPHLVTPPEDFLTELDTEDE